MPRTKDSLNRCHREHGAIFDSALGVEFVSFGCPEDVEGVVSHPARRVLVFDASVT